LGVRAGVDVCRPTHAGQGQTATDGQEQTKKAFSCEHLVELLPGRFTTFDARTVPTGSNFGAKLTALMLRDLTRFWQRKSAAAKKH
jgi:hypothetical protein